MKKNKILSIIILFIMLFTTLTPLNLVNAVEVESEKVVGNLEEIKAYEISEEQVKALKDKEVEGILSIPSYEAFSTNSYGSNYGYEKLDANNKKNAYAHMLYAASVFHNSTEDSILTNISGVGNVYPAVSFSTSEYGLNINDIYKIYLSFYYDNPIYYWLDSILYSYNSSGIVSKVILITKAEYALAETRSNLNDTIEKNIQYYLNYVSPMSNDFQKELMIHDRLIYYNDYALDSSGDPESSAFAHNIVGVFDDDPNTNPVCEGYAKAFSLLLNASGIDCNLVVGTANGGGHAWNQVKLDNEWYNVDVTWDDPIITNGTPPFRDPYYNYFNLTNSEFLQDHTPWSSNGNPPYWCYETSNCNSTKYALENQIDNLPDASSLYTLTYSSNDDISVFIFNKGVEVISTSYVVEGTKLSVQVFSKQNDLDTYYYLDVNGNKINLTKNSEANENGYIQYVAEFEAMSENMVVQVLEKSDDDFDLTLNKSAINFTNKNVKEQLVVNFKGKVLDTSTLSFTSDNNYAATVDKNGTVTSVGAGSSVITVRSEELDKEVTCNVNCNMNYLLGDIDNNSVIEITDAYYILRFIVTRLDYDTIKASILPAANFSNDDEEIDITDAYMLLRYVVKNM